MKNLKIEKERIRKMKVVMISKEMPKDYKNKTINNNQNIVISNDSVLSININDIKPVAYD